MNVDTSLAASTARPSDVSPAAANTTAQPASPPPIIPTASLFDAVDVVLDLSAEGRALFDSYNALSKEDRSLFIDIVGDVLAQGVVGKESLEVRGAEVESFASTRLGSEELRQAKPYNAIRRLDIQV